MREKLGTVIRELVTKKGSYEQEIRGKRKGINRKLGEQKGVEAGNKDFREHAQGIKGKSWGINREFGVKKKWT